MNQARLRVLFVEDDAMQQRLVTRMIAQHFTDIELVLARTLGEADDKLLQADVDAVILDLGLPDADHDQVFNWIEHCDRPLVIYTASCEPETIFEVVRAGALNVIDKGCAASQLVTGLYVALAEHRLVSTERDRRNIQLKNLSRAFSKWIEKQSESVLE